MLSKYEQVRQDLLREIKNHTFIPGDKFYSETDVRRKYAVSSITAVKTLNKLTNADYLYRIQGKGTFASKPKVSRNVKFSDVKLHSLDSEKVKVLPIEEDNQAEILEELGPPTNASYYRTEYVRYFEDIPFLVHITHLLEKLIKEPLSKDLTTYISVYERIREDFSIDLFSLVSIETNEIVFPEDAELLNLLRLSLHEPAVKQVRHSYLADGNVAEYIISYKHWKYFKTKIEIEAE